MGAPFDAYSPGIDTQRAAFGALDLTEGRHTLTVTVAGRNADSRGYLVGIDLLELALLD